MYLCVPEFIYVHHMHMTGAHRSQGGVLDCVELEEQVIVSHNVSAGN